MVSHKQFTAKAQNLDDRLDVTGHWSFTILTSLHPAHDITELSVYFDAESKLTAVNVVVVGANYAAVAVCRDVTWLYFPDGVGHGVPREVARYAANHQGL